MCITSSCHPLAPQSPSQSFSSPSQKDQGYLQPQCVACRLVEPHDFTWIHFSSLPGAPGLSTTPDGLVAANLLR